jgi:hypothetical protein
MGEAAKAKAKVVGTLSIRVKRAGSDEWEDHGTVPAYEVPIEPETPAEPEASAEREEK